MNEPERLPSNTLFTDSFRTSCLGRMYTVHSKQSIKCNNMTDTSIEYIDAQQLTQEKSIHLKQCETQVSLMIITKLSILLEYYGYIGCKSLRTENLFYLNI